MDEKQAFDPVPAEVEQLATLVLDAAFQVHRELGPGLLESVYERCLSYEVRKRGLSVETQVVLPIAYDGHTIDAGLRLDMLVEGKVIVEIKAVEQLLPVHEAQIFTYLKLTQNRLGFLINFDVPLLKEGIRRIVR
ncbi:GxxExxY protein [Aeoliella sp. ICT_H6.2]|uniref:GxxExxY protein n=1 Tax=Aeoliella straminimaris TaxID=2954799 RepID=A0A9X2JFH4_9BACT|nr:GxxExxY protein [Aeoliella straminimaris]MCO6043706.1 GxxExxY protein [Aeoliella straminimaris]